MSTEFKEWLNQNSERNYPFVDSAILLDSTEAHSLPSSWLVDAAVTVVKSYSRHRLLQLTVAGTSLTARFQAGADPSAVYDVVLSSLDSGYKRVLKKFMVDDEPLLAQMTFSQKGTAAIVAWGDGTYVFTDADLEPSCVFESIHKSMNSLSDILLPSTVIAGDILVQPGINMDVNLDTVNNAIRLAPAVGAGLGNSTEIDWSTCEGLIYSLNDAIPDSRGNVNIVGAGNVTISSAPTQATICLEVDGKLCCTPTK